MPCVLGSSKNIAITIASNFATLNRDFIEPSRQLLISSGAGAGGGGGGGSCPPALLPGGAKRAVLPFAFQYDSNEANAC